MRKTDEESEQTEGQAVGEEDRRRKSRTDRQGTRAAGVEEGLTRQSGTGQKDRRWGRGIDPNEESRIRTSKDQAGSGSTENALSNEW